MVTQLLTITTGHPYPLGATPDAHGVNFSVFSEHADLVELLLFDQVDAPEPAQIVPMRRTSDITNHYWHAYVHGLRPGAAYAYRVHGPMDPARGLRFDGKKVLADPFARGISTCLWDRRAACQPGDNVRQSMRGVVVDVDGYDWEGDRPLVRPMADTIIYEMHVRGFTKSPTSGVRYPGTFSGVIEKIPYLQSLGITAVELMPICQFDEHEIEHVNPATGEPLRNYWGYSTVGFFAPEDLYCVSPEDGQQLNEFRDMVKALHQAGIEVILDVVFNHTGEGNHLGPYINFKGFDNPIYYQLVAGDLRYYMDYSGCGNTVNCNHLIAQRLIRGSLEFWVREMHVDGFRFDEGSILMRDQFGAPAGLHYPSLVQDIALSEYLAEAKIIAEAWDAGGLYLLADFPDRWAVWNGKFRDEVRGFVKGDPGLCAAIATRIGGSADLFQSRNLPPTNSINFVTCHDGFTMNDLVSYNHKHNFENGEGNRDGIDHNLSWNCGVEGPTRDPKITRLRRQLMRNHLAILMIARGVPMVLSGDESCRTQRGNNNSYCQDTDLSWFNWELCVTNADMLRFFRLMIAFRHAHPHLRRAEFFTGQPDTRGVPDIAWHGCQLGQPGWGDAGSRVLACTIGSRVDAEGAPIDTDIHVMMNMHWEALPFEIPVLAGKSWARVVDTALDPPLDIIDPVEGQALLVKGPTYLVQGRSVVILTAR